MAGYRVAPNTQVNHEGRVYGAGEAVPLPEEEAAPLLRSGVIVEVPAAEAPKPAKRAAKKK